MSEIADAVQIIRNVINFNRSPFKIGDLFFSTPNKNIFSKNT